MWLLESPNVILGVVVSCPFKLSRYDILVMFSQTVSEVSQKIH